MRYATKHVEIEAMQFTNESKEMVYHWASSHHTNVYPSYKDGLPVLIVPAPYGGEYCAEIGDFIIKDSHNILDVVTEKTFNAVYESIEGR